MTRERVEPPDRVLSTLNRDGSRRWLNPKLSPGRFLTARRAVAWLLIAVFVTLPHLRVDGRPAVLLDVVRREFTILGRTFLPTDSILLALLLVGTALSIFTVTALWGRVWCGWACPQTVYMEFVFRPLERWAKRGRAWRRGAKIGLYVLVSVALAHTFLAYFVSWDRLSQWILGSPGAHPVGFAIVCVVSLLMLFDFAYFREQTCIIVCPYGRFQSVMLDRGSMIVTYDGKRGEPRGRASRVELPVLGQRATGDCIDCTLCVQTCPTGIDIRDGLQMECVGCAQCIDACDAVMTKIGRPKGLIRYSSQEALDAGGKSRFRPRLVVYPLVVSAIFGAFLYLLMFSSPLEVRVFRGKGMPFTLMASDEVANQVRLHVVNRERESRTYRLTVMGVEGARLEDAESEIEVAPGEMVERTLTILAPRGAFRGGHAGVVLQISATGVERSTPYLMLGPAGESK